MNNHLKDEQLINYAYHTLTDTQRETMDLHLTTCRDCRARLSEQEALQRIAESQTGDLITPQLSGKARVAKGFYFEPFDWYIVVSEERRVRTLDVSYPVFVQGSDVQWGTVRIGLDLEPMHREATRVRLILMAIGVAGVLVALLGARLISRKIIASIENLVGGTIQVSRGNLDHRIEIDSDLRDGRQSRGLACRQTAARPLQAHPSPGLPVGDL